MSSVGQEHDFGSLYAAHAPRVRRMLARRGIRREDLDDALQEAFVTIHRLLPDFEGRSSIETWLHSIAWRVAANFQRRAQYRNEVASTEAANAVADRAVSQPDPRVHTAVRSLDEEHRDIIALHEVAELTISELSALTGRARATVRERLQHGRVALRRRMRTALTRTDDGAWPAGTEPQLAAWLAQRDRELVHEVIHDDIVISTLDDIVIAMWRRDATFSAMELLIRALFSALEKRPEGIRYLCVVPLSKPPPREARKLQSWAAGEIGHRVLACAWVCEGPMMSLVAQITNATLFVGGAPLNARFFGNAEPAAEWLSQYGPLEPAQILARLERMRRAPNT